MGMNEEDTVEHPWDDGRESTPEELARAKPAREAAPHLVERHLAEIAAGRLPAPRRRGPQKAPVKKSVNIRLDADLLDELRATGKGWQSRVNDDLRRLVFGDSDQGPLRR